MQRRVPSSTRGPWSRRLSWCKYGVLALLVLAIPLLSGLTSGLALPAFCKYICPAGTLEGALPLVLLRPEYRPMLGWAFHLESFCLLCATGALPLFLPGVLPLSLPVGGDLVPIQPGGPARVPY